MTCPYIELNPGQLDVVNKECGTTEEELDDLVERVKEWIRQQPHLPKQEGDLFEQRLKCMLRYNKLSLEKTKTKLDIYYSAREHLPEFFDNREPKHPRIQKAMDTFVFVPLPKPQDDLTRVYFYRLHNPDVEAFNVVDFFAMGLNTLEMRFCHDLCVYEQHVYDFSRYTLQHIVRLNPVFLGKIHAIFEKAFSDRIIGMHFINLPSYGQTTINIVKSLMNKKMANRIHVHPDLESLYKYIPKRIIPKDYGGEEKPLLELRRDWNGYLENHNDWFVRQSAFKSNEALRRGRQVAGDLFGMEGSFRKLEID